MELLQKQIDNFTTFVTQIAAEVDVELLLRLNDEVSSDLILGAAGENIYP